MTNIQVDKKLSDKQLYKKVLMILEYLEIKGVIYAFSHIPNTKIINSVKNYDYISFKKEVVK